MNSIVFSSKYKVVACQLLCGISFGLMAVDVAVAESLIQSVSALQQSSGDVLS